MAKTARQIIMVKPDYFAYNSEAAVSNSFQNKIDLANEEIIAKVLIEFKNAVKRIKSTGVIADVFDSLPNTPDAVFPNNWFSTHENGSMIIYPMANLNRRTERNPLIIQHLAKKFRYNVIDISPFEDEKKYLEGTGSIVFDHFSKVAYAAKSSRTSTLMVEKIAELLNYKTVTFDAYGKENENIYHTNVMLAIGDGFAVVGNKTIAEKDRERVLNQLIMDGKEIISLTNNQVYNSFAGNMIQLENNKDQKVLVLSSLAYNSLDENQLKLLNKHNDVICPIDIPTIEKVGGGSARCMIAEIYQPI